MTRLVLCSILLAGCGGNEAVGDLGVLGVHDLGVPDLGDFATDPPPDALASTARVRFAALSPDKPPLDVCIAPHGTGAFTGPLLKPTVGAGGLSFGTVSAYLELPATQLDYRLVLASDGTCGPSALNDITGEQPLRGGQSYTVGVLGFITPPTGNTNTPTMRLYTDDATPSAGNVELRFIHASPDTGALDVGTPSGGSLTPIFVNVTFPNFGTSVTPQSDANGYVVLAALATPPTVSVRASGSGVDLLSATLPTAPLAGSIATLFAIGDSTGAPKPLKLLACIDDPAPPMGGLSACSLVP